MVVIIDAINGLYNSLGCMEMLPRNRFNQKRRVGNTEQGAERQAENYMFLKHKAIERTGIVTRRESLTRSAITHLREK